MLDPSPFDILADELGAVAGRIEREANLRIEAAISDVRRIDAERELRLVALEKMVSDCLALVKDGEPGRDGKDGIDGKPGADGKDGRDGVDGKDGLDGKHGADGTNGDDGQHGKDVDPELIALTVAETVDRALSTWDRPKDGRDGKDGAVGQPGERGDDGKDGRDAIDGKDGKNGVDGKDGERGTEGPPGKLPISREWEDRVYYEGEVATQDGATYQAVRDTGRAPPHEDWNCLAAAGRNGIDGRSFEILGTYKVDGEYRRLNVVALNGGAFVAKCDNPGPCPGEGWQLIASQGKQGKPGDRGGPGQKGDRGEAGSPVTAAEIDGDGLLRLKNGDGSVVDVDLYPVLSRLG